MKIKKTIKTEIKEQQKNIDSANFSFPFFRIEKIAKNISNKIQKIYGHKTFKKIKLLGMFSSIMLFFISFNEDKNKKTEIDEKRQRPSGGHCLCFFIHRTDSPSVRYTDAFHAVLQMPGG